MTSSSLTETGIEEMERVNDDQQPNRNNVIDLSTAIDGEIMKDGKSNSIADYVHFISSYSGMNIPTSHVPLTYDAGTHLVRVKNNVWVRDRVSHNVQYPIISAQIARQPAIVHIFAVSMKGGIRPHPFYEVFLIPSNHSNLCTEEVVVNVRILCVRLTPGMALCCDFIGIRTVSNEILQTRFPKMTPGAIDIKRSKGFRIVFRTVVNDGIESVYKLQMLSNWIYYRSKEVAMPVLDIVSHAYSSAHGDFRLMIFGKNFTSEALVIFRFPTRHVAIIPCRKFLTPTHLACIVPPFERQDIQLPVAIDVLVQCGTKTSFPFKFTYVPNSVHICPVGLDLNQIQ